MIAILLYPQFSPVPFPFFSIILLQTCNAFIFIKLRQLSTEDFFKYEFSYFVSFYKPKPFLIHTRERKRSSTRVVVAVVVVVSLSFNIIPEENFHFRCVVKCMGGVKLIWFG